MRAEESKRTKIDKVNLEKETRNKLTEARDNSLKKVKLEEIKIETKIKEKKIENLIETMPAGIPNLPIDESDLSLNEVESLENKSDILLNYEVKNLIPKKENEILKVEMKHGGDEVIEGKAIPITESLEDIKKLS